MIALCLILLLASIGAPAWPLEIKTAILRLDYPSRPPISRLDARPADLGFAGAALAIEDNQTSGVFTGIEFSGKYVAVPPASASEAIESIIADNIRLIVLIANDQDSLELADLVGNKALLFNVAARSTGLRDQNCRANMLHVTASNAMMTDAVTQFVMWKKWRKLLFIHGSTAKDRELAKSWLDSFRKFGAKPVQIREFLDTGGSLRTDTGHAMVQKQIPIFTQKTKAHDVVIASDAANIFAGYLPFHLWTPRPVAGSAGLRPVSLHPAHEAWGATQFQRRFEKQAKRPIQEIDYDTWLALRIIGEAANRSMSNNIDILKDYMLGEKFEIAGFKGRKLTFRSWNGQLRQPIILTDGRTTVSVSPQPGYLHQYSALDSLGLDRPQSACTAFAKEK